MSLWDDVEDIEYRPIHRTKPKYPTYGPGDGRSWHEYFNELRAQGGEGADQSEEDDSEYEVTVTRAAEEFDEPINALATYVKLLHANGWRLANLGHAFAFAKGKPFKTGANEGKPRPDQEIETQWVYAERNGDRIAVSYTIVNGKVRGNATARRMNGSAYADAELKARIKA